MSITYRIGDLLEQKDINAIAHCTNLYHTWGSGIVIPIKKKYPEAYLADLETKYADSNKLGTFSLGESKDFKVYNLYAMKGLGTDIRQLDYEAFYQCLEKMNAEIHTQQDQWGLNIKLGIPYNIGCDRAGGSWRIIQAMLEDIFGQSPEVSVVSCTLPQFAVEAIKLYNIQFESRNEYKSSIPFTGFPGNS